MKTLLVPTEEHDGMAAVLETARLVASRFDSYIEGFASKPGVGNFVTLDPVSSMTIQLAQENGAEADRKARLLFESFMQSNSIRPAEAAAGPGASFSWCDQAPEGDEFVGSYGRVFDLIILGRPGRDEHSARMTPLEAALFESGRPVLIAPPLPPKAIGDNILIAWNGSTEQSRSVALAMPILRQASRVTVLTVESAMTPGPTGEQAARHLQRHAIPAQAVHLPAGKRSAGEIILEQAGSLGCDLLIKGAYTQSRLRQMIFGGVTRHVLANATLPVLMAH
jgi:nucleotide-binding universal stress UspA family protein